MNRTILTALIAATAIAPVMASAQDQRGDRGGGSATRQAARAERQAARAAQPAPARMAQPAPARAAQPAPRQQGNPNREAFRNQRQADRVIQPQQGVDRNALRAERQAQRTAPTPQQSSRRWNGDRQNLGRDRTNPNAGAVATQQFRNNRQVENRRGNWAAGNNANRGDTGRWNRQWRNDDRYNWQSWRGQNRGAYRLPRYYAPRGYNYGYQRFGIGVTLGSILFSQNYWIDDPYSYRLPPAYGPYRWVRYYNDALLVDVDTGEVVDVIYDIFW